MINYWTNRTRAIVEKEVLIFADKTGNAKYWYDKMPGKLPAIFSPIKTKYPDPADLNNPIGIAHQIKLMKLGVEGVLKVPKIFHKYPLYLLYYPAFNKMNPFWVVIHKN